MGLHLSKATTLIWNRRLHCNTGTEWTAWGFLWPRLVWRCWDSRFVFSCVVTPSSPKRSVWRVYWKIYALHWFFLCFGFLSFSRYLREVLTLCSWVWWLWAGFWIHLHALRLVWSDIFNSRYLSSANSNWNLWQNKGRLEDKGRIQVFPRRFRAVS